MVRLAQHFLTDKNILRRIAEAAEVSSSDTVLEIGPGAGTLTAVLSERAKRVVAVEKDPALCSLLRAKFAISSNVKIVCGDILTFNPIPYTLRPTRYKVVANIPYYITGRLLRLMFENWPRPTKAVLMLQKEVAERIIAKPPKMNRLAAIIQRFAQPTIIATVRPGSFSPAPKVHSAIIALENIRPRQASDQRVVELVAKAFMHPRKYLASNLGKHFPKPAIAQAMQTLNLPPKSRSAELSVKEWERLSTLLFTQSRAYNIFRMTKVRKNPRGSALSQTD